MSSDDILYLLLLLVSIFLGWFLRPWPSFKKKKVISTMSGLIILFLVSGFHGFFCIGSFLLQALVLRVISSHPKMHFVSFVLQFLYLVIFRMSGQLFGDIITPYPPHTNAIQMILTLKMIGIAFEIHDSRENLKKKSKTEFEGKEAEEARELAIKFRNVDPSIWDLFHYSFSHIGLLTGPYYKYRTFKDLYDESKNKTQMNFNCDKALWYRLKILPLYIILFLISDVYFPLKVVESDEFYANTSFLWRLAYMTPVFFNFRMRLYAGFVLSECSCISAGLGAYPVESKPKSGNGPTDLRALNAINQQQTEENSLTSYNFETIHNIDEFGAEFVPTMREALKTWNMTVQFWLANIVYHRFPMKSVRTLAVMVISSVWHGIYPGYYLSLGSVPFVLMVEDLYARIMRKNLSQTNQLKYDWVSWFVRMQWFSYLGMAFRLLRIDSTLKFWSSIWYLGHLVLPLLYLLGIYCIKPIFNTNKAQNPEEKNKKQK